MMIMPYFSEDCDARKNNMNMDTESCLVSNVSQICHAIVTRACGYIYIPSLLRIVTKYLLKRLIIGWI